ncbi:MAG: AAA family ATPase [Chlamydiae bacterium]|nr:AAA family ATPase [Chlamydiota bacterium]MBI3277221.1 AAA family ATPase [Chlamydiota bacterium]
MKNPFSPTYPVNPQYFANRRDVLNTFWRAVERSTQTKNPTPDNIAILGEWGIGKSSVLRKFEAIALEEAHPRRIFCSLIELVPVACNSFASFSEKVIDDIDRNFVTQASLVAKIRNEIRNWRISSVEVGSVSVEKRIRKKSLATQFEEALIHLWEILEKIGIDTVILMLDDLHYLAERCGEALYDLRGIFQGLPRHGCNFILCCTGRREMFTQVRELAEPLTRFFNIKYSLGLFSRDEAREVVLKPIKQSGIGVRIEEAVIAEVYRLTTGHPFFIHFIMRELISLNTGKRITIKNFKKFYPKIEAIMVRERFEVDYSIASAREKEILRSAAHLSDGPFMPQDIRIKGIRNYLRMLTNKNLVTKHERGEYSLYHPLFKSFLKCL